MQRISFAVFFQIAHLFFILLVHSSAIAQNPSTNTNATKTITITKGANITKPGCPRNCGNLIVPYPFGVGLGSGCALNPSFEINCNTSYNPPKPLIWSLQVYEISDTQVWISNVLGLKCYNQTGGLFWQNPAWVNLGLGISTPYTFSSQNSLTVIGCDDEAMMLGTTPVTGKTFVKGCAVTCNKPEDVVAGKCLGGSGCCQVPIPKGLKYFNISVVTSTNNHTKVWSFDPCGYFFLGEADRFNFGGLDDLRDESFWRRSALDNVPIVLDWAVGSVSCDVARNGYDYACNENSHCVDADNDSGGYRCSCDDGYQGNPYLSQGCQDINECADSNLNNCEKICTNSPGSYSCSCPDGYSGDGKKNGSGCTAAPNSKFPWIKLSVGLGVGLLSLVVGVTWLYLFYYKRRKIIKLGEKTFPRIGGQTLKQRITKIHDAVEPIKTFIAEELGKATDNYASDRILGEGGHAIVYKGIFSHDHIVAIKTPIKVDHTKIEDFINEVLILTQVKHRNVVKLLGCCFETEVPLLVYEYVSNGTLLEHIHKPGESSWLSWKNRLRISIEIGSALAFLHSFASVPIIHRDIKSSNILLDDNYSAKVSDFGISRLIHLGQTHKMTNTQGTCGYWDPEYFTTHKLIEKSDVYSYGIVLCELLTGLPVIFNERSDADINLGQYLVNSMNKNCLIKILDRRILKEGELEQIQKVAELVKRCLHSNGTERPTMSEVVMELQGLTTSNSRNDNRSGNLRLLTF